MKLVGMTERVGASRKENKTKGKPETGKQREGKWDREGERWINRK